MLDMGNIMAMAMLNACYKMPSGIMIWFICTRDEPLIIVGGGCRAKLRKKGSGVTERKKKEKEKQVSRRRGKKVSEKSVPDNPQQ